MKRPSQAEFALAIRLYLSGMSIIALVTLLSRLFHRHGDLSDQGACIIGLICVAAALIVIGASAS